MYFRIGYDFRWRYPTGLGSFDYYCCSFGNADAPFRVHVDGKDETFRETDNSKTARTLSIQFGKDAKVIDIIGSTSSVQ